MSTAPTSACFRRLLICSSCSRAILFLGYSLSSAPILAVGPFLKGGVPVHFRVRRMILSSLYVFVLILTLDLSGSMDLSPDHAGGLKSGDLTRMMSTQLPIYAYCHLISLCFCSLCCQGCFCCHLHLCSLHHLAASSFCFSSSVISRNNVLGFKVAALSERGRPKTWWPMTYGCPYLTS